MTTASLGRSEERWAALRCIALVPAHNEESTIAGVVGEIKRFDPDFDVLVIDDGSTDETARAAQLAGADVVSLPFNLGIGGAVQTGLQFAHRNDFDIAVQVDGDAQHDPMEIPKILGPVVEGHADLVVGSRFLGEGEYEPPLSRLLGIKLLSRLVSLLVRERVTDPTSGFRARSSRPTTPRLPGGGSDRARFSPPAEAGRGSSTHAAPRGRPVIHYVSALRVLHGEGSAGAFHRAFPTLSDSAGGP